ncbi:MAG: cyclic nucleotide-binding domain-containing protein [Bdellovibrionales bacterium]
MAKETIILERCFVPKGQLIVEEGEDGSCAYLIQSGSVSVYTNNSGQRVNLAKLSVGDIFGELALVFDEPRSASVVANEDCNLIVITRQTMQRKLDNSDPTVKAIVGMLTKRILTVNNTLVSKNSDMDDLIDTSRIIYQNVLTSMPRSEQRSFQKTVLPKLDAFLDSIREFQSDTSD